MMREKLGIGVGLLMLDFISPLFIISFILPRFIEISRIDMVILFSFFFSVSDSVYFGICCCPTLKLMKGFKQHV